MTGTRRAIADHENSSGRAVAFCNNLVTRDFFAMGKYVSQCRPRIGGSTRKRGLSTRKSSRFTNFSIRNAIGAGRSTTRAPYFA